MKNCLTCKHEPNWCEWTKGEYSRCSGACQWLDKLPDLPATYQVTIKHVIRYSDDSGIETRCKVWMAK